MTRGVKTLPSVMKRPSFVLYCALLGLTACGPGTSADSSANRNGGELSDRSDLAITVSGRAEVFPEAARLLAGGIQPVPSLEGFPLTVEEPLRVGVSDADAVLGRGEVGTDGTFSVDNVSVGDINLSLAVSLEHDGYVRASTIVFDTAFTRTRPRTDLIDTRVWALPDTFHDALTRAISEARIRAHTDDQARTLRAAGFILGRVVDASGAPRAGVQVVVDRADLAGRIYYPSEDLQSATQTGTSATGLFVYVHTATDSQSFGMSVQDDASYVLRNVGATPGMAIVVTLAPGNGTPE